MTTNHVLGGLISLTLVMQAVILYKDFSGTPGTGGSRRNTETVRDAPEGFIIDLTDLPTRGSERAKVVMVEFSDYECPFCARHTTEVQGNLNEHYVLPGKLRHVFANNPLAMHPNAKLLATAALCAGDQNAYWEMHDLLFAEKFKEKKQISAMVAKLRLDEATFSSCFENPFKLEKRIERDMNVAIKLGMRGTPSFALGLQDSSGRVVVRKTIHGAVEASVFHKVIDDLSKT